MYFEVTYILQLIPLKAGDRVYMRISGYNWFRIEKETFHLALIRLNDWPGLHNSTANTT